MKAFFVGEGRHDIGKPSFGEIQLAAGVIPGLCKKLYPEFSSDCVAIEWTALPRFSPDNPRRFSKDAIRDGYGRKLKAAVNFAISLKCSATIAVADQDGDPDRIDVLRTARDELKARHDTHGIIVGVAVRAVESWSLGDPKAFTSAFGIEEQQLRRLYSVGDVESLNDHSGKPERRPKGILESIAKIKHRTDCLEFREDVVAHTCIDRLKNNCPQGFAPFITEIEKLNKPSTEQTESGLSQST